MKIEKEKHKLKDKTYLGSLNIYIYIQAKNESKSICSLGSIGFRSENGSQWTGSKPKDYFTLPSKLNSNPNGSDVLIATFPPSLFWRQLNKGKTNQNKLNSWQLSQTNSNSLMDRILERKRFWHWKEVGSIFAEVPKPIM